MTNTFNHLLLTLPAAHLVDEFYNYSLNAHTLLSSIDKNQTTTAFTHNKTDEAEFEAYVQQGIYAINTTAAHLFNERECTIASFLYSYYLLSAGTSVQKMYYAMLNEHAESIAIKEPIGLVAVLGIKEQHQKDKAFFFKMAYDEFSYTAHAQGLNTEQIAETDACFGNLLTTPVLS